MKNKRLSWLWLFFMPLLMPVLFVGLKTLKPPEIFRGSAGVVPSISLGERKSLSRLSMALNQETSEKYQVDWFVQVDAKGMSPARGGLEYDVNTRTIEAYSIIRDKSDKRVGHDTRWTYTAVSVDAIHQVVSKKGKLSDLISHGAILQKQWSAFPRK